MALVAMSGITTDTSSTSRNWWESLLTAAPAIITASTQGGQPTYAGGGVNPYDNYQPQPQSTGISTNTILLIGAAGLAAYFLLKKK